jgi:hypothetical protein
VVDAARVRLGIAICYELEISEYSAALADRGAVNDEEVAVARLELGGHCSRSIPARSNRAVTSRSGRPHRPADQPVSQTSDRAACKGDLEMAVILDTTLRGSISCAPSMGHVSSDQENGTAGAPALVQALVAAGRRQCDCEDPSGSCSAAHSHSSRQISSMSERLARPRLSPRMNSNAGKSSRCQLTENSQGQLAVFAIDLAPTD